MNKNTYESPLCSRYASERMQYIFSPDYKFLTWHRLWLALAENECALGLNVTAEQVEGMSLAEKMDATRKFRESEYEKLIDAVYPKRGWTLNGVPKIEHLKKIGMDLPELIEIVAPLQDAQP